MSDTNTNKTLTLAEVKAAIRQSLGTPKSNLNAATCLAGTTFEHNGVVGRVLPTLSAHGKLQAEMTCSHPGCTKVHVREQSDWHQARFCHEHTKSRSGVALSPQEKAMRALQRAQAQLAALGVQAPTT